MGEYSESLSTSMEQQRQEAEDLAKKSAELKGRNTELQKENTQLEETTWELDRLRRECKAKKANARSLALLEQGEHLKAFLCIIEPELLCPIEYELVKDPVLAAHGYTYERHAIKKWQDQAPGDKFAKS